MNANAIEQLYRNLYFKIKKNKIAAVELSKLLNFFVFISTEFELFNQRYYCYTENISFCVIKIGIPNSTIK